MSSPTGKGIMDFERYLEAKRTVDSRSMNTSVMGSLGRSLESVSKSVRVVEAGAGTGAMIPRLFDHILHGFDEVEYVAVDKEQELIEAARCNIIEWAKGGGYDTSVEGNLISVNEGKWNIRFLSDDIFDLSSEPSCDILVAHAFVDLLDLPSEFEELIEMFNPQFFYLPITFDGSTRFFPTDPRDEEVERNYHGSMKNPEAGSIILDYIMNTEAELVDAGPSDWFVLPRKDGYVVDEDYFLDYILGLIERNLDFSGDNDWIELRRKQLREHELAYTAKNLDIMGRL